MNQKFLWVTLISAIVVGLLWQLFPFQDATSRLQKLPKKGLGYQGENLNLSPFESTFFQGMSVLKRKYIIDGKPYLITVIDGTKNRHAVHDPTYCFRGSGWDVIHQKPLSLPNGKANLLTIQKKGEQKEALYWFSDGNRQFSEPLTYWLLTALRRMTLGWSGQEPVLVVVQPQMAYSTDWEKFTRTFHPIVSL